MGWVKDALRELSNGKIVKVRPLGGSMRGRIESGQLVTIRPVMATEIQVDDIVFVRWKGTYILHLVKEIRGHDILIVNNLGKVNGWASIDDVCGKVTEVTDWSNSFGSTSTW